MPMLGTCDRMGGGSDKGYIEGSRMTHISRPLFVWRPTSSFQRSGRLSVGFLRVSVSILSPSEWLLPLGRSA